MATENDLPDQTEQIDFGTLGMFIIDEIHPPPSSSQPPQLNIIGGAGTYSALGARLFSPPPTSHSIAWMIDCGTDFPPQLLQTLKTWQTGGIFRERNAPTTRGWNGYSGNDHREFKYLTEKKRITAKDLTPHFLKSKSFHLICGPERCIEQVHGILSSLPQPNPQPPIFIWEPVPDLCTPSSLPATLQALKSVDIISPNHEELASLFGTSHPGNFLSKSLVETQAHSLRSSGIGPQGEGAVIVRCGAQGCYILSSSGVEEWLPAYHTSSEKVVDPTGGGNGFLGGLAVGMVRCDGDLVEAARWGSVSASLCIEQVGVPVLGEGERWNGVDVFERLEEFRRRTG